MPGLLQQYAWDVRIGSGGPSLWEAAGCELEYSRSGGDCGVEPIAIIQDHLGVLPRMLPQLLQEFCLYHNLRNVEGRVYKKLYDDGTEEVACEVNEDLVRIRTKLLRQFQAAAQLVLVKYMNSIVATSHFCDDHVLDRQIRGEDQYLHLSIRENKQTGDKSSLLMGKKVIFHPPRSARGQWPFTRQEEVDHQEFIIGETPEGGPIKYTCDPDALDNYLDLNPGAPHYLTPVYFSPEVLDRYYSDPKYEVRDGYLSCGGLWGVRVDNNHLEHVTVWLGDLERDLPEKGEKSITLLDRWLDHRGHQQLAQEIDFLRKINDLRNVSEHRAGRKRTQAFQKHQIGDDKREAISALFEEAILLLDSLGEIQAEATIKQS